MTDVIDVFDTAHFDLDPDPESFRGEDFPSNPSDGIHPMGTIKEVFPPIVTPEEAATIKKFYDANPQLKTEANTDKSRYETNIFVTGDERTFKYDPDVPWIQTYSGRRFCPTNPNPDAIVIQDIAHALSMQCRFSGHVRKFYSVAQHSVLVSYVCDAADAMWGLLHDASEAYLVDVPRPLKQSGKFGAYIEFEKQMQLAVCKRFGLPEKEPPSVKTADTILLSTEARDLMSPLHPDWRNRCDPLPFKIEALPPDKAKDLFMKRFFELRGDTGAYEHYLRYEYNT